MAYNTFFKSGAQWLEKQKPRLMEAKEKSAKVFCHLDASNPDTLQEQEALPSMRAQRPKNQWAPDGLGLGDTTDAPRVCNPARHCLLVRLIEARVQRRIRTSCTAR